MVVRHAIVETYGHQPMRSKLPADEVVRDPSPQAARRGGRADDVGPRGVRNRLTPHDQRSLWKALLPVHDRLPMISVFLVDYPVPVVMAVPAGDWLLAREPCGPGGHSATRAAARCRRAPWVVEAAGPAAGAVCRLLLSGGRGRRAANSPHYALSTSVSTPATPTIGMRILVASPRSTPVGRATNEPGGAQG